MQILSNANRSDSQFAPVALFVYNRPDHVRRTVDSLRENGLARHSDLYVFCDGAKNVAGSVAVQQVREYVRSIQGFRSLTVIERERNLGCGASVIQGISEIFQKFERTIVVEDDLLTATDFLTFVNRGLDQYAHEPKIFSVCGFKLAVAVPAAYNYDAFCSYRFMATGWGTWRDRWEKVDWSVRDFGEFMADREQQRRFNQGGDDLTWMLARQRSGKLDTWDTTWQYAHFKHDAVALLPTVSKVYHFGWDESATHCRREAYEQTTPLSSANSEYRMPNALEPDPYFVKEYQRLFHRSLVRRVGRYVYDKLGLE